MTVHTQIIINDMTNKIPRNDWGEYLTNKIHNEGLNAGDLSDISDVLTSCSAFCAELSAYIDYRGGVGCGGHGHKIAMKKAQVTKRRIRKVFGYSSP